MVRASVKWMVDMMKAYGLSREEIIRKLRENKVPRECWEGLV